MPIDLHKLIIFLCVKTFIFVRVIRLHFISCYV